MSAVQRQVTPAVYKPLLQDWVRTPADTMTMDDQQVYQDLCTRLYRTVQTRNAVKTCGRDYQDSLRSGDAAAEPAGRMRTPKELMGQFFCFALAIVIVLTPIVKPGVYLFE